MKGARSSLAVGLCALAAFACAKHETATSARSTAITESTGPGSAAALVTATATVVDIDQATRMVTLQRADGEVVQFHVDESVRNLPQVRKGDQVTVAYYESLAIKLSKAEGGQPSVSVAEQLERAPLGDKPGGVLVRDVTLTAKVTAVDRKKQTVTLEGPQGNSVTLKVADPQYLDRAEVGHLVEATYREAVAISVQKPTK